MSKKSIIILVIVVIIIGVAGYFLFGKITNYRPPTTSQYTVECPEISVSSKNSQSLFAKVFGISVADATTQQPLLNGKLCFIDQPLLNKPTVLEFRFVSRANSSDVKANITLPKTFELVSGNTEWTGNLDQGQQKSFRVTVRPTKTGYYHIDGSVTSKDNIGRPGADKLSGIDIDVTSNGTIVNPVWNKTFSPSNNLYLAVYPENNLWTVSQKFSDDRFTEFDFGHALSPENFEPIITVTYYRTGYVDNQTKVNAGETEVNVNKKNLKTKEWTYYPAVRQTITTAGKTIERAVISNWNGYDIRIDLLKAEYLPAFDTFVKLFTVTF